MSFCNKIVNEIKFYFNLKGSYLIKGYFFFVFVVKKVYYGFKL